MGLESDRGRKKVRVVIEGRVQGVAYRASCEDKAVSLGVNGWVRNRWDGGVEGLFEGPADAVDALVVWCKLGPPAARVTRVDVTEEPAGEPLRGFHVR